MTSVRNATGAGSSDAERPGLAGRHAARPTGKPDRISEAPHHLRSAVAIPVIATGAAWVGLVVASSAGTGPEGGHPHAITTASGLLTITVMTVAMMGPLTISGVRAVASASTGQGQGTLSGAMSFCAAFLGVWTVIAICLQPVAATVIGVLGSVTAGAAVLLALSAADQFDPRRRDPAARCGKPPTGAPGVPHALAAARCGGSSAIADVRFCALPMLAMLALPGSLLAMAAITALTVLDRATVGRYRWSVATGYAAVAAAALLF